MHGIGWAVRKMREGRHVCRPGWNGKGMFLIIADADWFLDWPLQEHVMLKTTAGSAVPWTCSQSDLLADDWEIADD